MRFIDKILLKRKFKSHVMILFLPIILIIILIMGVSIYLYESYQDENNKDYLINNATRQAANLINDKFVAIFNQCNSLSKTTAVWRLINNSYRGEKSKEYSDIILIYNEMQNIYSNNNDIIDSIAFKTINNEQISVYKDMVYDKLSLKIEDYVVKNYIGNFGYIWLNSHVDKVFPTIIPRNVISLVLKFKNNENMDAGIMIFNMKSSYFKELLDEEKVSKYGYVMLLSENGVLMPNNINKHYLLNAMQLNKIKSEVGKKGSMKLMLSASNRKISVYYSPLTVNKWLVVSVVPQMDLSNMEKSFKVIFLIMVLGSAFIAILILNYGANFISKPIEKLTNQVLEFQKNPNVNFNVKAGYEITLLANKLNNLNQVINKLLEQVKEEQKQKSRLELAIMQAQIKPHFLYNTLASIKLLIDMQDNEKAKQMCTCLIQFYKIGLSNGKDVITIGEEIEHVRNYLMIQQFRYENFEYSIEISEEIIDAKILRLSLQPLVENAIYHGINPKEGTGIIIICGEKKDNKIVLTIYDDGVGMNKEKLETLRKSIYESQMQEHKGSFGLKNVYTRLKLFFGEGVIMSFDSCEGVFTQVTLELPILKDGNVKGYDSAVTSQKT
ncbi:sensor histidine kinase [Thermoanaerobacterium thermosaccharolyticum]|uniref:sensor histidine kinase n=1 Tax=Thermoanaerobacterium thermosaccharolyticum TaxID=1517 RepID=UPI003DA7B1C9